MFKSKRIIYLGSFILLIFISAAYFLKQKYVVPIIMYHSVTPEANPENRLTVSTAAFRRQMRFLKSFGYNIVPLEEIAALIRDKKKVPAKTIAVTFDDGYIDNYTYAFPVLKEYKIPATIFIIVDEVGRRQNDRLNWSQIEEMQKSGLITFGSHCLGPVLLKEISSAEELKRQIFDSKKILEKKLAKPLNLFSYPGGGFDDRIKRQVIEAGYMAAVTTSPGRKFSDWDIFALKRLRISSTSDNLFVFWIETSGFYTFLKEHRDDD